MNRRGFLGGLFALAAPAVIRMPGLLMPIRPIIMPPMRINGLLTPSMITHEALRLLERNLISAGRVNEQFARKLSLRLPTNWVVH